MPVKFKIEEARFFLRKIEQDYRVFPDNEYYMSAFLSAAYSIRDHVLDDYSKKFQFKIPHNWEFKRTFKQKAMEGSAKGNKIPLEFLSWYNKKIKAIDEDVLGSILKENRHEIIHHESIEITDLLEDAASIASSNEELERWKNANPWLSVPIFNANGIATHIDQCKNILSLMEDFVKEALEKFPNELIDTKINNRNIPSES